jgi:hypothetical protein
MYATTMLVVATPMQVSPAASNSGRRSIAWSGLYSIASKAAHSSAQETLCDVVLSPPNVFLRRHHKTIGSLFVALILLPLGISSKLARCELFDAKYLSIGAVQETGLLNVECSRLQVAGLKSC